MIDILVDFINTFHSLFWFVAIITLTFIVAKIIRTAISAYLKRSHKELNIDKTQYAFLKNSSTAIIFFIGLGLAIYMMPGLRTLAISMFAGAGILAIVLGFAAQETLANLIAGLMIVISKPYRVGDWIVVSTEDVMGSVENITLRHTIIRTRENRRIIIPNSVMGRERIINFNLNEDKTCHMFEIGISYDSDIDLALKIIEEEALKHPNLLDNRSEEEKKEGKPIVRTAVTGFGNSSVNLRAWCWADAPFSAFFMGLDMNKSVKERFDKEGVEIPFPYRTVVYKKDLPRNKTLKKTVKKQLKKR